ncbi:hypothetical protein DIPPA_28376 [Diplonema papillatum]|nr:hypothetical protein DIPPA_28376 [Diplonema papillatum]
MSGSVDGLPGARLSGIIIAERCATELGLTSLGGHDIVAHEPATGVLEHCAALRTPPCPIKHQPLVAMALW